MISIEFLYFFVPVFMALYFILSPKIRCKLTSLASAAIVCWVHPAGIIPFLVSVFSGYIFGILIYNFRGKRRKQTAFLISAIVLNIGAFVLFVTLSSGSSLIGMISDASFIKDAAFFGVPVYTLHAVSYCADIYRGRYGCCHSFAQIAEYISFFPVLCAGPILRFDDISETLKTPVMSFAKIAEGIKLLLVGYAKKLILADAMFELWCDVKTIDLDSLPALTAWIGAAAYVFSLYFSLWAFSDIGRGLGLMLGFNIGKNFDIPFRTLGFSDFVRKFNMSLFNWINDYVFFAFDKKKKSLRFVGIFIVSVIGMLWYGVGLNTLLFGIFIGIFIIIETLMGKHLKKVNPHIRRIVMLFLLLVVVPVLARENQTDAFAYCAAMFGANNITVDVMSVNLLKIYLPLLAACVILSSGIVEFLRGKIENMSEYIITIIQPVWVIALLLVCTSYLISTDSIALSLLF